jgi:thiol-disulfide isomerase/thioredoxin
MMALAYSLLLSLPSAEAKPKDTLYPLSEYGLEGTIPDVEGKIVILDFWASWCGPCAKSFPALDKFYQEYQDKGVIIIGVSVDEDPDAMKGFLKKIPVHFPIVRDAKQKLVAEVNIGAMPTTVILDSKGHERYRHRGFHGEKTIHELRSNIQTLQGE